MDVGFDGKVNDAIIKALGWVVAGLSTCLCFFLQRELSAVKELKGKCDNMSAKLIELEAEKVSREEAEEIARRELDRVIDTQSQILDIVRTIDERLRAVTIDTEVLKNSRH